MVKKKRKRLYFQNKLSNVKLHTCGFCWLLLLNHLARFFISHCCEKKNFKKYHKPWSDIFCKQKLVQRHFTSFNPQLAVLAFRRFPICNDFYNISLKHFVAEPNPKARGSYNYYVWKMISMFKKWKLALITVYCCYAHWRNRSQYFYFKNQKTLFWIQKDF